MIPNLIIPGAAKSGTSSLHEYLNLHPDIEMSRRKEPHYFTIESRYKEGFSYYDNLFNNRNASFYGESSTAYFNDDISIERIARDLPDVKLIVILREPISRAISHYLWLVGLKQELRSFRKAMEYSIKNPTNWQNPDAGGNYKAYFECSLYGRRLEKLIKLFGYSKIHVITTKEISENPNETLEGCFDFLGLVPIKINLNITSNKTTRQDNSFSLIRSFGSKALKRGIIDLRLLYLALNQNIGKISEDDKKWLSQHFEKDRIKLSELYPDIQARW